METLLNWKFCVQDDHHMDYYSCCILLKGKFAELEISCTRWMCYGYFIIRKKGGWLDIKKGNHLAGNVRSQEYYPAVLYLRVSILVTRVLWSVAIEIPKGYRLSRCSCKLLPNFAWAAF